MNLFYGLELEAALSLVKAMETITGGCVNPNGDECNCEECIFPLDISKRTGNDFYGWCMKLVLEDWRIQLQEKQTGRSGT